MRPGRAVLGVLGGPQEFGGLGPDGLTVRKVKDHLDFEAIDRGLISRRDRFGNSNAALWAKFAATRICVARGAPAPSAIAGPSRKNVAAGLLERVPQ